MSRYSNHIPYAVLVLVQWTATMYVTTATPFQAGNERLGAGGFYDGVGVRRATLAADWRSLGGVIGGGVVAVRTLGARYQGIRGVLSKGGESETHSALFATVEGFECWLRVVRSLLPAS